MITGSSNRQYGGAVFRHIRYDERIQKAADNEIRNKSTASCAAITTQKYFYSGLPTGTIRTLYRVNVRSILLYGTP